jgi:DNA polymerase-3 subunit epsilon
MSTFLAIDFETANYSRDSACAVGLAVGTGGRIVDTRQFLIRPPGREFVFTHIHGLTWRSVKDAVTFDELWPTLVQYIKSADFLVAHNAPFDRSVLEACCTRYRLTRPRKEFECTVRIARSVFGCNPAKLPDVCGLLGIPLKHHDAGSDAEACGRIVLEAEKRGWAR